MSVRLQLEDGRIKEYATWYDNSGGEPSVPVTYYTKCGLRTDKWPKKSGACDHVDCAIYAIENETKKVIGICGFSALILFAVDWYSHGNINESLIIMIFFGIIIAILRLMSLGERNELLEFRDHGTIGGIKARKL